MKKSILMLSTLVAVVAPIATVLSCGTKKQVEQGTTGNSNNPGASGDNEKIPMSNILDNAMIIGSPMLNILDNAITTPKVVDTSVPWTHQTDAIKIDNSVPWTKQTKAIDVTPLVAKALPSSADALLKFKTTIINEDPRLPGFIGDIDDTPREFKQYDNGLFKIKIQTSLIGDGKYFASEEKADLLAREVARTINIGPAITHLSRGIQIMESDSPTSKGGQAGVQISESNRLGSANDEGLLNDAALIDHEYGHHETMWDFEEMLGGSVDEDTADGRETMREAVVKAFKDIGYDKISQFAQSSDPAKTSTFSFVTAEDKDMPSDYGVIPAGRHKVLEEPDYLFSAPEIVTRMLNILSFRTDLSPADVYTIGAFGHYPIKDGKMEAFEPPTNFISDASIRRFTGDSVFAGGKDSSRVDKLINFYMKDIFGLGSGNISLEGDPNKDIVTGLELSAFDTLPELNSIEVVDAYGKIIGKSAITSFNSRMGFKNELVSNDWTTNIVKPIREVLNFHLDIKDVSTGYFKVIGKDINGNNVDISKLNVGKMVQSDGVNGWKDTYGLSPEGDHFYISMM